MAETDAKKKVLPTSIWLDADTRAVLDGLTKELELSRSAVVREALHRMSADPRQAEIRKLVMRLFKVVTGGKPV